MPTLVAIGHEVDTSLAELAADMRASTPSNAVVMLLPDKTYILASLVEARQGITLNFKKVISLKREELGSSKLQINDLLSEGISSARQCLKNYTQLFLALSPQAAMQRGYSLVLKDNHLVKSIAKLSIGDSLEIRLSDGTIKSSITEVKALKHGKNS